MNSWVQRVGRRNSDMVWLDRSSVFAVYTFDPPEAYQVAVTSFHALVWWTPHP